MPNWECPTCHMAVQPDERHCPMCQTPRPSGWEDQTWGCGRCGHRNSNRDHYCRQCGARPGQDAGVFDSSSSSASSITEVIRRGNDDLLASIRDQLADAQRELREGLGGTPVPKAPVPERRQDPPASQPFSRAASAIQQVTTRNLELQVQALPKLNAALLHAGVPLIQRLQITNTANETANDVLIRIWVAPDYGEPWQRTVGVIPARSSHVEGGIAVPLRKARLQEVLEAEQASLRIDVHTEGALQYSDSWPLEVLAYNEWYYHPDIPQTVACFVQPNSPAVERIVTTARDRLRKGGGGSSLSGYQSGGAEKVIEMVRALYLTLQEDLHLSYINPPPSFEQPQRLSDGRITLSQKVFFPEQILEYSRGTCLDLALLAASCLERMGLHPLFFLMSGHAYFGIWLDESMLPDPVMRDVSAAFALAKEGKWLALNSTTFAASKAQPFEVCVEEARRCLAQAGAFQCVVDIASARRLGIKPVPPLVAGAAGGGARGVVGTIAATCPQCGGAGEIECIHCYGSGKHGADPRKPCAYCRGEKRQQCPECGGSGVV